MSALNPNGMAPRAANAGAVIANQETTMTGSYATTDHGQDHYGSFIARKLTRSPATGMTTVPPLPAALLPHQRDLVAWALRRGRAAIFADTGLGKTLMLLAWAGAVAAHTGGDVLILAPLAVAAQTAAEGARFGLPVTLCREGDDVRPGVNVTNYDRLHRFDAARFVGIVLDESSCIKHYNSHTLRTLLESFRETAWKLCDTATPAPNDWTELGTHAEFLGVCTRQEMLAEFFCHDGGETQVWRLKGHARAAFWRFVATWAALVRKPSDLGHDDGAYDLPALTVREHIVATDAATVRASGALFATEARSLMERRSARKASTDARVAACAARVNADGESWVVWCDLNAESEALARAIPGAVEIRGADDLDVKEARLAAFARGEVRVLVTKPSICGWGLNWQHCARTAFVGVTDSWEAYYQAVRRFWRFGQRRPVEVEIYASEAEGAVVANLRRKETDARAMAESLSAETRDAVRDEVRGQGRVTNLYAPATGLTVPAWLRSEVA